MSRVAEPYHVYRRTDNRYRVTLYPVSGLPASVCAAWMSKSFANLPPELARYREPRAKAAAHIGATLLIEYLKRQLSPAPTTVTSAAIAPVNTGKLADKVLSETKRQGGRLVATR